MRFRLALSLCALALAGCKSGAPFDGLAPAQQSGGPVVRFDLRHQPLPEIPFPNDVATRPDATSPTGLRVNAALIAPTQLEGNLRAELDRLDGFGTYAPISVAFDLPSGNELDLVDLYARQNDKDPANDAVLLLDLLDGTRYPLDLDSGHFPYELQNPGPYFTNDPLAATTNLLFPVDGSAPNFLHALDPTYAQSHQGAPQASDDLAGFYERFTHTLIVRPVLPLPQEHRFAVVLTTRLRDTAGRAVTSPFSGINHALQTSELLPLPGLLPAGTALSDVAFAWAFTTQTVTRDLEAIRAGLHGTGPLAALAQQYPVQVITTDLLGNVNGYATRIAVDAVIDLAKHPDTVNPLRLCASPASRLPPSGDPAACANSTAPSLVDLLQDPRLGSFFTGGGPAEIAALVETLDYVDYLVFGRIPSPDFLTDPDRPSNDATFQVDVRNGSARAQEALIPFVLAVPRTDGHHAPPFPVAIVGHGYKSNRLEGIIAFSGTLAKFGIASIAIDAYGHGLGLPATSSPQALVSETLVLNTLDGFGLRPLGLAVLASRARDLDFDGVKDPGGDFWTADAFHTRDVVRQSIVDWMQVSRVLRTFDGTGTMEVDPTEGDGGVQTWLAGDFNHDGVVDIGGPAVLPNPDGGVGQNNDAVSTFVMGVSLGGILSGILPAVEPDIVAAAPVSSAGGLSDVGIRSGEGSVKDAVFLELFGPLLVTCPYSAQDGTCGGAGGVPSLVWEVLDVNNRRDVPIAPLALAPGDVVTACDLLRATGPLPPDAQLAAATPAGCVSATADSSGNLRLSLAADAPQLFAVESGADAGFAPTVGVSVVQPGDPVHVVVTRAGGGATALDSFQVDTAFYGVSYDAGTPLVSIARGFGEPRNTPGLRRLWALSQTALEPGDPINYAPHWFGDLLPARSGLPANVVVVATGGDPIVPVNTGIALGRAAGLVELNAIDPAYGLSDDRVLIAAGVVEGVARLGRFANTDVGVAHAVLGDTVLRPASIACPGDGGCDTSSPVLVDPASYECDDGHSGGLDGGVFNGYPGGTLCFDGLSCGAGGCATHLAAPRLDPPLRDQLTRVTRTPDGNSVGVSALLLPLLNRTGQHGFRNPQPDKQFDMDQFLGNLIGRYFETRGRELHFEPCQAQLAACPWTSPPRHP